MSTLGQSSRYGYRTGRLLGRALAAVAVVASTAVGLVASPASAATTRTVCASGCGFTTIQGAVNAAVAGDTILVSAGVYHEDVNVNKALKVQGAGSAVTTVSGPIGGGTATFQITANNVLLDGFTITRDGNTVAQWNLALNLTGIAIQTVGTAEVRNNLITGNRTGIDINASSANNIHDNDIVDNRSGIVLRNQTNNTTVAENHISGNWTLGVLFLDASGGSNVPLQQALNSTFRNNDLSDNWYGDVVDRQSGGSLPAPGTTNLKNFSGNWFGTAAPTVTTADSSEPSYASQVPVEFGGTAMSPGGQAEIAGPASANVDFTPTLESGADTDGGAVGFQGNFAAITITAAGAQVGTVNRVQEGVTSVTAGGTIHALAGNYPVATAVQIAKSLTFAGPNAGISPNDPTTPTTPNAGRVSEATVSVSGANQGIRISAPDVTIDGLRFTDPGTSGASNTTIIGAGGNFGGVAPRVAVRNNLFDGVSRIAVYFNGPTITTGGIADDNRAQNPTRAAGCGIGGTASSACGHQLFNLWNTDQVSFQRNVVVAPANNGDRVRILNVDGSTNVTIADNTSRSSCTFTCFTVAGTSTNVTIERNDLSQDSGNAVQLASTWNSGVVTVRANTFNDPTDYAVVVDNTSATLSGVHVNRNAFLGGGVRNGTDTLVPGTNTIDGTCNWWGTTTGPVPVQNFGPVAFEPWLVSADLVAGPCVGGNAPAVGTAANDATGNEGSTVGSSGSFTDPAGLAMVLTADNTVGTFTDHHDGTWGWSYASNDEASGTITVTATNTTGKTATDVFTYTVNGVAPTGTFNAPPSAVETTSFPISITGVTDPSGPDTAAGFSYAFDCGSGYGPVSGSNTATCTAPLGAGSMTVKGKVFDKDNLSSEYTASVTVVLAAAPTVASAAADAVGNEGSTITASGGFSDPNGFALALSANNTVGTFTDHHDGTWDWSYASNDETSGTITVTATNTTGKTATDVFTYTVNGVAPTGTFNAPPSAVETTSFPISITGVTDPSGPDTAAGFSYAFDCGSGYGPVGGSNTATCTAPVGPGTMTVKGKVFDKDGLSTQYTASVTVVLAAAPTVATAAADAVGNEGSTITASGGFSDPNGFALALSANNTVGTFTDHHDGTWDWSYASNDETSGTITVTATNTTGKTATDVFTYTVNGVAPTGTFNAPGSAAEATTFVISLTGVSDPSGPDTAAGFAYAFDCGGGYGPTGASNSATCTAPVGLGTMTVKGKVVDKNGLSTQYTATVAVVSSLQQKQAVLNTLLAMQPLADKQANLKLNEAIDHLRKSMDPALWIGGSRLTPKQGMTVFTEEDLTVRALAAIKTPVPGVAAIIHNLWSIDRTLAQTAISDAIAGNGNAKLIASAQDWLQRSVTTAAAGDDANAITFARQAWNAAQQALN